MFQLLLALMMIPILIKAVDQVKRDPTFTRRRILQNVAAIAFFSVFVSTGFWVLIRISTMHAGTTPTDREAAVMVFAFLAWLTIGLLILLRLPGVRKPR